MNSILDDTQAIDDKLEDLRSDIHTLMARALAAEERAGRKAATRFDTQSLQRPVKPGDVIVVRVGGVEYETVIDQNGTQRFRANGLIRCLRDAGYTNLNTLAMAYGEKRFTQREYAEFNMALGYSVSGFAELSSFQDMLIENPLWNEE